MHLIQTSETAKQWATTSSKAQFFLFFYLWAPPCIASSSQINLAREYFCTITLTEWRIWNAISNKRSCLMLLVTTSILWLTDLRRKTPSLCVLEPSASVISPWGPRLYYCLAKPEHKHKRQVKSCWQSTHSDYFSLLQLWSPAGVSLFLI